MEKLLVSQVVGGMEFDMCPGGNDMRTVQVCNSICVDSDGVALAFRQAGVSVENAGCLGTQGGCKTSGVLAEGAYVRLPTRTKHGVERSVAAVVLDHSNSALDADTIV